MASGPGTTSGADSDSNVLPFVSGKTSEMSRQQTIREEIELILREQIELAKPDDLAFLEFQVSRIARDIMNRLCLLGVPL
jgi:hypothetical protein